MCVNCCLLKLFFQISDYLNREMLASRKNANFDKSYEDCMVRIQRIKQRNDVIQKQIGTDIEDTIRTEVNNQKKFIEKEIVQLKELMNKMEKDFRDPESKTKMKQIKTDAHKQIQRNKIILKELINKSFANRSLGRSHDPDENEHHMLEGGRVDYEALERHKYDEDDTLKQSLITDNGIEIDYEIERKILLEKNQIINEVQQSTIRINEIMNDMAGMVEQQGQNLDIITDQLIKTNENMIQTNKNLEEASSLQKKSRKKYVFLVALIILIIIVVAGIIFFLTK